MKRAALYLQFFFLIPGLCECGVSGPPFNGLPPGERVSPDILNRRYSLQIPLDFYRTAQKAELTFENAAKGDRTFFYLRTAGINPIESIRVRSYEGLAYQMGDALELRAERCYIHGKKDWEDRLVPLEGWDCEHMIFQLTPRTRCTSDIFETAHSQRTVYTEWFGDFAALAMPASTFAGQILTRLDNDRVVLCGRDGGRILRDGQILEAYKSAKDGRGVDQPAGRLRVVSRPGDFIIAKWEEKSPVVAYIALTRAPKPGRGSIFD